MSSISLSNAIISNSSCATRSSSLFQKGIVQKSQQNKTNPRCYSKDNKLSPRSNMMKLIPLIKTVQFLNSKIKKHQYFLWCRLQSINANKQNIKCSQQKIMDNKSECLKKQQQKIRQTQNSQSTESPIVLKNQNMSVLLSQNKNSKCSLECSKPQKSEIDTNTKLDALKIKNQTNKREEILNKMSECCLSIQHKYFSRQLKRAAFYKFRKIYNLGIGIERMNQLIDNKVNTNSKRLFFKSTKNYIRMKIKAEILYNTLSHFCNNKQKTTIKQFMQIFKENFKLNHFKSIQQIISPKIQSNCIKNQPKNKQSPYSLFANQKIPQVQINQEKSQAHQLVQIKPTILQSERQLQYLIKKVVRQYSEQANYKSTNISHHLPIRSALQMSIKGSKAFVLHQTYKWQDAPIIRQTRIQQSSLQTMKKISHLYSQAPINQISDCFDSFSIFQAQLKINKILQNYKSENKTKVGQLQKQIYKQTEKLTQRSTQRQTQIQTSRQSSRPTQRQTLFVGNTQCNEQFKQRMVTQKIQQFYQQEIESQRLNSNQNLYPSGFSTEQFKTCNSLSNTKLTQRKKSLLKLSNKKHTIKMQSEKKCNKIETTKIERSKIESNKQTNFKPSSSVQKYKFQNLKKSSSCRSILVQRKSKQQNKISININIPSEMQKYKEITKEKHQINTVCNQKSSNSRIQWKSDKKNKYQLFSCQNKEIFTQKAYSDQKTVRINKKLRNIPCSQFIVEPLQTKILSSINHANQNKMLSQKQKEKDVGIKGKLTDNVFSELQVDGLNSNNENVNSATKSKTNLRSKLDKVQYNTAKKMKMQIQSIINQRKKSSIGIMKI